MKKTKLWVFQIAMAAIVSLAFGSPVLATPPDHANAGKTVTAASETDEATHGEMNRLENANLEEGKAAWKVVEPEPACSPDNLSLCTTEPECLAAGGSWFDPFCVESN